MQTAAAGRLNGGSHHAGQGGSATPLLRGDQYLHTAGELGQFGPVPAERDRGLDNAPLPTRDLEGEDLGCHLARGASRGRPGLPAGRC